VATFAAEGENIKRMPTYISQARMREVADIAYTYWYDFVKFLEMRFNPDDLFNTMGPARINPCALAFFRYCAEIRLGKGGATVSTVSSLGSTNSPSWLWHQGNGVVWILLDLPTVQGVISVQEERKLITRIILHEIGHVVLHYPDVSRYGRGNVPSAEDHQEEEAWLFSGILLGLALGLVAKKGRGAGITDLAWSKSC
jgi:hypothetical protein